MSQLAPGRRAAAIPAAPESHARLTINQVYDAEFAFVWRTLRRLGVPPARLDDAVQEVFIVVARRLPEFDGSSQRAWIAAIARRVAAATRRAAARTVTNEVSLFWPDGSVREPEGTTEALDRADAASTLYQVLDTLDAPLRDILVLAELEGMSVPEVAEALELNVNTAHSRLRAARRAAEACCARLVAGDRWRRA